MSYVPTKEILSDSDGSIYKLVILAAKRTAELNEGAAQLVECKVNKPQEVAIEEIKAGKVKYKVKKG